MTHLIAFAAGVAIGWYLGLNAVYHAEPQPWTRDDDAPIAPADPRADGYAHTLDFAGATSWLAEGGHVTPPSLRAMFGLPDLDARAT
jgi:hypothetical protein